MKKNILIAIVLCVFNSVAAFAQTEKEYSMVISLQNGSTITLGHNDIKNITFTGDNVSAEGNIVTSFADLQNQFNESFTYLRNETKENRDQISYVENKYDKAFKELASNADKAYNDAVAKATEMKAEVEAKAEQMQADMQKMIETSHKENLDFSYDNRARIEVLQKQNDNLEANAVYMKTMIEVLQSKIEQLKKEISDMKK